MESFESFSLPRKMCINKKNYTLINSVQNLDSNKMKTLLLIVLNFYSFQLISTGFIEASLNGVEVLTKNAKEHVNFDKLKVKRMNRTHHGFLGELEVFEDFGNQYTITGLIYQQQGYEYRLTPFKLGPLGWCEFIEKYDFLYKEFLAPVSDFPEKEDVSSF